MSFAHVSSRAYIKKPIRFSDGAPVCVSEIFEWTKYDKLHRNFCFLATRLYLY